MFARNTATGAFLAMFRVSMEEEVSAAHKITGRERVGRRTCGRKCVLTYRSGRSPPPAPPPSSASFNRLRPVQKLCVHQVVDV